MKRDEGRKNATTLARTPTPISQHMRRNTYPEQRQPVTRQSPKKKRKRKRDRESSSSIRNDEKKSKCTKQGYIGRREAPELSRLFNQLLIASPGFNAVAVWQVGIKPKPSLFSVEKSIKIKALKDVWIIQSAEIKAERPL